MIVGDDSAPRTPSHDAAFSLPLPLPMPLFHAKSALRTEVSVPR